MQQECCQYPFSFFWVYKASRLISARRRRSVSTPIARAGITFSYSLLLYYTLHYTLSLYIYLTLDLTLLYSIYCTLHFGIANLITYILYQRHLPWNNKKKITRVSLEQSTIEFPSQSHSNISSNEAKKVFPSLDLLLAEF